MSNIETPAQTPTASPAPASGSVQLPPRPRSRVRRFVFASVLLLTGGVIGAVATTASFGFGPGPRGWHGEHGPAGWRDGGSGGFGSRAFFPGRIERGADRILSLVDASTEQRQKITGILNRAGDDLYALRSQHLDGRRQMRDALAAATIDRGTIESLRVEQMKLAETATKRISEAVTEAAETLNPAQRADLARRMERWERWFRG